MSWSGHLLTIFFSLLAGTSALGANSGITYQGRILRPDGTPLSGQYTQFKMQIRTPDSQDCLMYEELQTQNLSQSSGAFSITINDGTGTRTDSSGLTLDQIFANHGTDSLSTATCASGSGQYTPNPSDGRNLVVSFKDETMSTWEPIPAQKINFVPFAFEAKQVQGFAATSLLRVYDSGGFGNISPLSNAQYAALLALANGSSTAYTAAGTLGGSALPTMSSGQVLGWNGSAWVSEQIGSTQLASGAVGSTQLSSSLTINTSGTVGAAVTTTRDFKIYAASPSTYAIDMQAPALTASYSLVWPLNAGTNGQVLTTDGSGNLSWGAGGVSSQWTTHGSNISYDGGGNVGIGTTAPAGILDVEGGTAATVNSNGTHINIVAQSANGNGNGGDINLVPGAGVWGAGSVNISGGGLRVARSFTDTYSGSGTGYPSTITIDHSFISDGNTMFVGFTSRNSSAITQGAYFGAITAAGAANYAAPLVWGQKTGASAYLERMRVDSNGNVGIGTTTPSARLALAGGTATAGTAPLKLGGGVLLTTPEDGAMEYDSSSLYYTIGSTRYVIPLNTASGNYSNVSTISNTSGSITMSPMAGNSVIVNATTVSTSSTTGALVVSGGEGVAGAINASGNITSGGSITATTSAYIPQLYGSNAASGAIRIDGTSNATPGNVYLASLGGSVGVGTTSASSTLSVNGGAVIGTGNTTAASGSLVVGSNDLTTSSGSFAAGNGNIVNAAVAGAIGNGNQVGGIGAVALGNSNSVSGASAMAFGQSTIVTGANSFAFGLGVATGTAPQVSGANSFGIFMGDQSGTNITASNVMSILGGNVGIGTTSPTGRIHVYSSNNISPLVVESPGTTASPAMVFQNLPLSTSTTTGKVLSMSVAGEVNARAVFYSDGKYGIGPGLSTRDTFISRAGTSALMISSDGTSTGAANLYVTGNVGIGTTSPAGLFVVQGGTNPAAANGAPITLTAQSGGGSGSAGGDINLNVGAPAGAWGSGSVKINLGAGSPGVVDVAANGNNTYTTGGPQPVLYLHNDWLGDGKSAFIKFGLNNTAGQSQYGYMGVATTTGSTHAPSLVFGSTDVSGAYAERLRIDPAGNVGIGTTSPSHTLEVAGSFAAWSIASGSYQANNGSNVSFLSATGGATDPYNYAYMLLGNTVDSKNWGLNYRDGTTQASDKGRLDLTYYNGSTYNTYVSYLPSGNVGIGTTSPAATLDINGTERLKLYAAQPFACASSADGTLALTSHHTMCVCNGTSTTWVAVTDGTTSCSW